FQPFETLNSSTKCKDRTEKSKRSRSKMPIWNDYSKDEDDGHRHFEANCYYCDKRKWQHSKPSIMEAYLALYCKGLVPDNIRNK
ncbi:1049_t:CDS:1, partial [Cetraspora pellucida]